jgi:hypothetical protein
MADSPKQRAGAEPDLRRERAYREEAEALREDLAQYLREGAVGEEVRGLLAAILREELPGLVRAALADEGFRATLRREVADSVLEGLGEQVRARRPLLDEPALPQLPSRQQAAPVGYAVAARPVRAWLWGLAGLVAGLLAAVLVMVFVVDRPRASSQRTDVGSSGPAAPAEASGSAVEKGSAAVTGSHVDAPVAFSAADLRQTWLDLVKRNAPPAGSPLLRVLRARGAEKAFDCWLGGGTSDKLGALVRDAAVGTLDEGVARQRLAAAFAPCVGDYAAKPGAPSLVVYAAQAAANQVFVASVENRPESCGEPPAAASADGKSGAGTETLLNALEACSGGAALPRIDAHSGPRGYLLSLYLGLSELRREAKSAAPHD